ncbi:MAG: imidazole glycerol phosphate synthase subunit HisH [Rhodospirillaceae bacterium]|nr:imidazole glycerol phosphate synthase subunit HisH [Rhodospirillaceae bacterium]
MPGFAVIDYGAGNTRSVVNACRAAGANPLVVADGDQLRAMWPSWIVMPGVGAVGSAMASLRERRLIGPLEELVHGAGVPFLGICVGMQLLATRCREFGDHAGLNWIPGQVNRIAAEGSGVRVPHVGWNNILVDRTDADDFLLSTGDGEHFYFQHSFAFAPDDPATVLAWSDYAGPFVCAVRRGNIAGVQFHPEKSGAVGRAVLAAFAKT